MNTVKVCLVRNVLGTNLKALFLFGCSHYGNKTHLQMRCCFVFVDTGIDHVFLTVLLLKEIVNTLKELFFIFRIQIFWHSPYPSNECVDIGSVLAEHFRQPSVISFHTLVRSIHNRIVKVRQVIIDLVVLGIIKHLVIDTHGFTNDSGATCPCEFFKISHCSSPSHTAYRLLHETQLKTNAYMGAVRLPKANLSAFLFLPAGL